MFIGLQNTGDDGNYLLVWPSLFEEGAIAVETGFIRLRNSQGDLVWAPLWDVVIGNGDLGARPLNRTALPMRARFVIDNRPTAIEISPGDPRAYHPRGQLPESF